MRRLTVLMTNNTLDQRAGSELYLLEVARGLLARGYLPVAYSTSRGPVAEELRRATVPVVEDLSRLEQAPDLIHGQHHLETMTALLRFPGVPAVFFCHGWLPWEEMPPLHPRIRRYVAVDEVCRDRLTHEAGVPAGRVRLLLNFVDLARFHPRPPLPARPARALVFSNYASEQNYLPVVREACARAGVRVEALGLTNGNASAAPEALLGEYDLVFAKGRAALEALAVGCAVILCDRTGAGPLVCTANYPRLRPLNCGIRCLNQPLSTTALSAAIARYEADDAAAVSRRLREEVGLEAALDRIEDVYRQALDEQQRLGPPAPTEEAVAAASYLRQVSPVVQRSLAAPLHQALARAQAEAERWRVEAEQARRDRLSLREAVKQALGRVPLLDRLARGTLSGARACWRRGKELPARLRRLSLPPAPFIVGAARSGTTLLRLMLDAHPELAIPAETGFFLHLSAQAPLDRQAFFEQLTSLPTWEDLAVPREQFREELDRLPAFTVEAALRAFYRCYARRQGKTRWGDKTPDHGLHLHAIAARLPEARFLHLIRDGRDVAVSLHGLWFSPGESIEARAAYWRDRVQAIREQGHRCPHYLEVRYEQLIQQPEATLRALCRFLRLPFSPGMLSYHQTAHRRLDEVQGKVRSDGTSLITREQRLRQQRMVRQRPDPSRIGRWRAVLTAEDQRRFEAVAGGLLDSLGYPCG